MKLLKQLIRDDSGAVATEYVVIVGLIAVALIAVIIGFRKDIVDVFNGLGEKVNKDHSDAATTETPIPE